MWKVYNSSIYRGVFVSLISSSNIPISFCSITPKNDGNVRVRKLKRETDLILVESTQNAHICACDSRDVSALDSAGRQDRADFHRRKARRRDRRIFARTFAPFQSPVFCSSIGPS